MILLDTHIWLWAALSRRVPHTFALLANVWDEIWTTEYPTHSQSRRMSGAPGGEAKVYALQQLHAERVGAGK